MDRTWEQFLRELDAVRAVVPRMVEFRDADDDENIGVMEGHFSVFNTWYEVNSLFEGEFLERVAPGAFAKTIAEGRDNMKVLFDHGHDRHIGNKVLGPIRELREDNVGPFYSVPLLDTSYNRDLLPGLREGLYGSSFRFRVIKDEWNDEPEQSDHNPQAVPERTIKEVRVFEFGPVTFPANPDATAGVRSLTDVFHKHTQDSDSYEQLLTRAREIRTPAADGTGAADPSEEPPQGTRRRNIPQAERMWEIKVKELNR